MMNNILLLMLFIFLRWTFWPYLSVSFTWALTVQKSQSKSNSKIEIRFLQNAKHLLLDDEQMKDLLMETVDFTRRFLNLRSPNQDVVTYFIREWSRKIFHARFNEFLTAIRINELQGKGKTTTKGGFNLRDDLFAVSHKKKKKWEINTETLDF